MSWLDDLGRDLRHAVRSLGRNAGFTATVTLILALGIGANTAMFSIVYGVLLRPLPYPDADGIVRISEPLLVSSASEYLSNRSTLLLQGNAESFEQIAVHQDMTADWDGAKLTGGRVSPSLFPLLRAAPHLGRLFLDEEAVPGTASVVLLSHGAWTSRFGADPSVVGTTMSLNGDSHLVVGVLSEGLNFPSPSTEFWVPYVIQPPADQGSAGGVASPVIGRLRPGVSAEQAAAEIDSILQDNRTPLQALIAAGGDGDAPGARVIPLLEEMVGEYRPALWILTAVAVLALLVASLNVAGLLLARGVARRRLLAISAALGASRGRLVRQLLTESVVLTLIGGAAGLTVAGLILSAVPALAPVDVARLDEVGIDGTVFAFTAGLSLVVGLLCGAGPALQCSQVRLVDALNEGSAASGSRTHRLRTAMSAMQVAAAVMLLIGAGLFVQSLVQLLTFDRGFDPTNVITMEVSNPLGAAPHEMATRLPEITTMHQQFHERLVDEVLPRIQPLADVEAVGLSRNVPFGRNVSSNGILRVAGTPLSSDLNERPRTALQVVSPGYLDTLRFRLRAGRTFTPQDGRESPRVLVANETLARQLFGNEPAVGRRVDVGPGEPWEVVGVVGDIVYDGLDLTGERQPEAYFPLAQATDTLFGFTTGVRISVRTASGSLAVVPFVREAVTAANPQATISEISTMETRLLNAVAWPRLYVFFVGSLAGLALILAAVGIYGLLSYTVAQREREIGIRMALGARSSRILALVIGQGVVLVGVGGLIGVGAATVFRPLLESFLYGVAAGDSLSFLVAPLVLAAVALAACWFPARRAARVDPVGLLRLE